MWINLYIIVFYQLFAEIFTPAIKKYSGWCLKVRQLLHLCWSAELLVFAEDQFETLASENQFDFFLFLLLSDRELSSDLDLLICSLFLVKAALTYNTK